MKSRPSGHTAVMAGRQATAPDALDYFPTPPWAARAGGELIKRIDGKARSCWEPACGEGHMAFALQDYFDRVVATDIFDYGMPAARLRGGYGVADFLDDGAADAPGVSKDPDWIISNPPFKDGEAFVRTGLKRARRGVAMLLRSVFLEGAGRYPLFTSAASGFAIAAQFAERVPMVKGRWDPQASSATAYSWFVWVKPGIPGLSDGLAERDDGFHLGTIIPPGTRKRLSKAEDLAEFCGGAGDELFGG